MSFQIEVQPGVSFGFSVDLLLVVFPFSPSPSPSFSRPACIPGKDNILAAIGASTRCRASSCFRFSSGGLAGIGRRWCAPRCTLGPHGPAPPLPFAFLCCVRRPASTEHPCCRCRPSRRWNLRCALFVPTARLARFLRKAILDEGELRQKGEVAVRCLGRANMCARACYGIEIQRAFRGVLYTRRPYETEHGETRCSRGPGRFPLTPEARSGRWLRLDWVSS